MNYNCGDKVMFDAKGEKGPSYLIYGEVVRVPVMGGKYTISGVDYSGEAVIYKVYGRFLMHQNYKKLIDDMVLV